MSTRTSVALAALAVLLAVPAAAAGTHSYHRTVAGPGVVYATTMASAGVNYCDDNGTVAQQFNALDCGMGGLGGAIIDVSDLPRTYDFVSGTCSVSMATPVDPATDGQFGFVCGVNRDDDGRLSNVDDRSSDPDGVDDDFASEARVRTGSATVNVCFRRDLTNAGGADWDNVQVHVAMYNPSTSAAVGTFEVDLELTPVVACSVSAHTHRVFYDDDREPAPLIIIPWWLIVWQLLSWLCFW
jgi:hypothetical protein